MAEKILRTCPRCGERDAVRHCSDDSACEWLRCRTCKSTTDPVARRGFTGAGVPFALTSTSHDDNE